MDYNDLADFVGTGTSDAYVQTCWSTAVALVDAYVGSATVPAAVLDRCYLECGSELFHRRNAPNGVAQFNEVTGTPVRIARDPMVSVYPLVAPYVISGIPVWGD